MLTVFGGVVHKILEGHYSTYYELLLTIEHHRAVPPPVVWMGL